MGLKYPLEFQKRRCPENDRVQHDIQRENNDVSAIRKFGKAEGR